MDKKCKQCDEEFKSNSKQTLYCSSKCRTQAKKKPRDCEYCGGVFLSKNKQVKFCSNKCASLNRYKENHVKLTCEGCGKDFTRIKSKVRYETSFCSTECSQGDNKPTRYSSIEVNCARCGVTFCRQPHAVSDENYCSADCYHKYAKETGKRLGINNGMYNDKLSEQERIIGRNYTSYYQWRTDVFERDDFTCVCCGKKGGKLNAHHMLNYSSHPALRTDLDNGVTLCDPCHKSFHSIYGSRNNTKEQFDEFIRKSS